MKKIGLFFISILTLGVYSHTVSAQDFDTKLKRFVTIADNGRYAPEISCDEAVKLGFTINDYNRFAEYVERLNAHEPKGALTAPENRFLHAFIRFKGKRAVLDIPLEKALRAGATAEGYRQVQKMLSDNETFMQNEEFFPKNTQKTTQNQYKEQIKKVQQEMADFARQHPDSCAVQKFFAPRPIRVADK